MCDIAIIHLLVLHDERYDQIHEGILASAVMLLTLKEFLQQIEPFQAVRDLLADSRIQALLHEGDRELSAFQLGRYHYLLLHVFSKEIAAILDAIYQLDVYMAVSAVAEKRGFFYARALPKEDNIFKTAGISVSLQAAPRWS
ncbi:hypothetical protein [Chitinophaga sancti]|uniref:Uncharacterized protein n=1 Tax=Chitinophaga sancti TaxID=1004 RepID=A0A1K1SLM5_9BACT|nr:hypothetical protein [Chitinophaga sancti]WQD65438.1 hypothetical protein U0033_13640 [Chitinophaga sancti]WQG88939.1 hypothetical protein SR876_28830 [Chitinophaga sancti]SFW84999.1 hypothetical protein SAMN05661012_05651 [Chitinophaga sancti]